MNEREQFICTTKELLENDENTALILAGISMASFEDDFQKYSKRVINAGICEQAVVGVAAGMAICGMVPIVHTIAPFLVERAYEQLKIDFGYQKLRGNFITTGGSLDYSSFGATHQCPADIALLRQIPDFQVIVPGTADEFKQLFLATYSNNYPTYYRLSRDENKKSNNVEFGKAIVAKKGTKATVIAIGPMLDMVVSACQDLDVTILYYTTVAPFDKATLLANANSKKFLICQPFYVGSITDEIVQAFPNERILINEIGIKKQFSQKYGYTRDHYENLGISENNIRCTLEKMINE